MFLNFVFLMIGTISGIILMALFQINNTDKYQDVEVITYEEPIEKPELVFKDADQHIPRID